MNFPIIEPKRKFRFSAKFEKFDKLDLITRNAQVTSSKIMMTFMESEELHIRQYIRIGNEDLLHLIDIDKSGNHELNHSVYLIKVKNIIESWDYGSNEMKDVVIHFKILSDQHKSCTNEL